jgi:hypothetical protein
VRSGLGDANAISMSLYTGSYRQSAIAERKILERGLSIERPSGWLLTGDSKLGNKQRRNEWLRFYAKLNSFIGQLMIPHHGASGNFHSDILKVGSKLSVFVCADNNDPKHPHEDVLEELDGRQLPVVTEAEESRLVEISGPSALQNSWDLNIDYLV